MTSHNKQVEVSEIIHNLVHTLSIGQYFKSYRGLCNYFGLKSTGGNSKKAVLGALSRYCNWQVEGNSYTVISIFDFKYPKIDKKFLNSKLYPSCAYLLLKYLALRNIKLGDDKPYYIKKGEIMKIIFLCNTNYSESHNNKLQDKLDTDDIFKCFHEQASSYLYNLTLRILKSLKFRGFIIFEEVYKVKKFLPINEDCKNRISTENEATSEEVTMIEDGYKLILEQYNIKNKNAIRLSRYKEDIYYDLDKYLGFGHYKTIRFSLTAHLATSADYLFREASLTEFCSYEVNSLVCDKIYNKLFKFVHKIREEQVKKAAIKEANEIEYRKEQDQLIKPIKKSFAPRGNFLLIPEKYSYDWNFTDDDTVLGEKFEEFITQFIRCKS